jgi:hypothetical protein
MSRIKKIIRNIFIIVILFYLITILLGLHFTPLAAHESSERGLNYGPSEIIHIENYKNVKFILGKYDKWVSCDIVTRTLFFFWGSGGQSLGFENDETKKVCYTWSGHNQYISVYGFINDKSVKKIEVTLSNGEVLTQTNFYKDLFLLTWESKNKENMYVNAVRGYDIDDKLIYVDKY